MRITVLLTAIGGFVGALIRYAISTTIDNSLDSDFTLGIFIANFVGCFIAGILIPLASLEYINYIIIPLLSVGFCGSLTTFSTYILDILQRFESKRVSMGFVILFATSISCFLGLFLGYKLSLHFMKKKEEDVNV